MQPLVISDFKPKCEVTITSKGGVKHTLTQDCVSVNIVRGIDNSSGAFTINLTAAKDSSGLTWRDKIQPMDFVEIRAGNKRLPNGKLPIRIRGFVTNVHEELTMPISGGPFRSIAINGLDYVMLFMDSNIQFLFTMFIGNSSNMLAGLTINYNLPIITGQSVKEIFETLLDDIFNGSKGPAPAFLPLYEQAMGFSLPRIKLAVNVPDKYQVTDTTILSYTGNFWALMNYYAAQPLSEFFMYDDEDGPVLVARICPYKNKSGNFPPPGEKPILPDIKIDPSFVSGYSIGKTVQDVRNFFFCFSDIAGNDGSSTAPMYASLGMDLLNINPYVGSGTSTNPAWVPESADKFGLRVLNVPTPYLNPISMKSSDTQPKVDVSASQVLMATELSSWMRDVFGHNEQLTSGTLTCHGSEDFIPGRYFTFSDMSGYIEQVSELFQFTGSPTPSWSATITFTRGQSVSGIAETREVQNTSAWTSSREYRSGGHPAQ